MSENVSDVWCLKTSTQHLACSQCQMHTVHALYTGSPQAKTTKDIHTNKEHTAHNNAPSSLPTPPPPSPRYNSICM